MARFRDQQPFLQRPFSGPEVRILSEKRARSSAG
jgi:hypothetical protein